MKSGLTIREDNYSVVLDALKQLSGTDVLVGIPQVLRAMMRR
jgi:hypothetical protein